MGKGSDSLRHLWGQEAKLFFFQPLPTLTYHRVSNPPLAFLKTLSHIKVLMTYQIAFILA